MKRKILIITFCLLMVLIDASFAQDRRRPGIGRRLPRWQMQQVPIKQQNMLGVFGGYDFESEQYLIGAQFWLPTGVFWNFVPSFNYHFKIEDTTVDYWQFNGDLVFKPRLNGFWYVGGGLAVDYLIPEQGNSDTRFGGSILTGLMFEARRSPVNVFVQGRYTFLDDVGPSVTAGMNLALR